MPKLWKFALFSLVCSLARTSGSAQAQPNGPPAPASQAATDTKSAEVTLDPIANPPAIYPPQAQERKIQGKVTAKFLVSESGDVEYVEVPKDQPVLDLAVQDAIVKWRFKPVLKDGKAAAVVCSATFNFVLGEGQDAKVVGQVIGTASVFPARVQLAKGVAKNSIVHRVQPEYPQSARAMRVEGSVVLQARIDKQGNIADLQPFSGPKQLVQAAMDAVKQWRYKPFSLLGQPVEVETQIQVDFSLAGG
jgi:TonB family protein